MCAVGSVSVAKTQLPLPLTVTRYKPGLPALLYDDSFFTLCFTSSSVKLRFTSPISPCFTSVKHKVKLYFILGVGVKSKVN